MMTFANGGRRGARLAAVVAFSALAAFAFGTPVQCCCEETPIELTATAPAIVCVGEPVPVTAYALDWDLEAFHAFPFCPTQLDGVTVTTEPATPVFWAAGPQTILVHAEDAGQPVDDSPVTVALSVCAVDATMSGVPDVLFYKCYDVCDSAVVTVPPPQCPGVAVTWTVSGPLEKVAEGPTSVTIRATNPAVGQCSGTVTCAIGGCSSSAPIRVAKPNGLVVVEEKHVTFDSESDYKGDTCFSSSPAPPHIIWGWVYDMTYRVVDQCGRPFSVSGAIASESFSGYSPEMQNDPALEDGVFHDCVGGYNRTGPITDFTPPVTTTQTWTIWGCTVGTVTWTYGNTDGTRNGP